MSHDVNQYKEVIQVSLHLVEATDHQAFEVFVHLTVIASQQVNVFFCQLKGRGLEVHATRGGLKHEAEINVDEVPLRINEDVPIVPVLHIEQVVEERVPGQTLREIFLCLIEVVVPEIFLVKS